MRLWRRDASLSSEPWRCGSCASKHEGAPLSLASTQSCGNLVPALPRWDTLSCYGHQEAPAEAVAWWEALPVALTGEWRVPGGVMRWVDRQTWRELEMPTPKHARSDDHMRVLGASLIRYVLSEDWILVFIADESPAPSEVDVLRRRIADLETELTSLRTNAGGAA